MTREELEQELQEKKEDLEVFSRALSGIHERLLHSQDYSKSQIPLHKWAGATGVFDIMTMVVNNMEHVVEELEEQVKALPPGLRVIEGGSSGESEG